MTSLAPELFGGEEDRLRFMSFSEAMMAAEELSSPFNVDSAWQELYLHLPPGTSNTYASMPEECHNGIEGFTDSLLCNIKYEQIVDALQVEWAPAIASQQPAEDLLIQDCMWSSSNDDKDTSIPANTTTTSDRNPDSSNTKPSQPEPSSADCVEPSVVFPTLHHATPQTVKVPNGTPMNTVRSAPSSSESEEEIDVVTVEHRSDHQNDDNDMDLSPTSNHKRSTLSPLSKSLTNKSSLSSSSTTQHTKTTNRKIQAQASTPTHHNSSSSNVLTTSSNNNIGKIAPKRKRHTKRHARLNSQDGNESDEEARRASHNVLERKRRNDLKNSFDILRTGIPDLEENIRAPKVVILRKAVEYIKVLQANDKKIEVDWSREHKRNNKLRERLSFLRKNPLTI